MGAGRRLKELNPALQVVSVEPDSPFHGLEGLKHMGTALKPGHLRRASWRMFSWRCVQKTRMPWRCGWRGEERATWWGISRRGGDGRGAAGGGGTCG